MKYWKRIKSARSPLALRSIVGQFLFVTTLKIYFCINYVNCKEEKSSQLFIETFFFSSIYRDFVFQNLSLSLTLPYWFYCFFSPLALTLFHGGIMGKMICYLHDDRFSLISFSLARKISKIKNSNRAETNELNEIVFAQGKKFKLLHCFGIAWKSSKFYQVEN